jgi:hypothetical protein
MKEGSALMFTASICSKLLSERIFRKTLAARKDAVGGWAKWEAL